MSRDPPQPGKRLVDLVQRLVPQGEERCRNRRHQRLEEQVPHPEERREPGHVGNRPHHGKPHEHGGPEQRTVDDEVRNVGAQHQLDDTRHMDQTEHAVEQEEGDERLGEDLHHRHHRPQHGTQQPPRCSQQDERRCRQRDDQVLGHVEEEEAAFPDVVNRPAGDHEQRHDPGVEEETLPSCHGDLAARGMGGGELPQTVLVADDEGDGQPEHVQMGMERKDVGCRFHEVRSRRRR